MTEVFARLAPGATPRQAQVGDRRDHARGSGGSIPTHTTRAPATGSTVAPLRDALTEQGAAHASCC